MVGTVGDIVGEMEAECGVDVGAEVDVMSGIDVRVEGVLRVWGSGRSGLLVPTFHFLRRMGNLAEGNFEILLSVMVRLGQYLAEH
jgi:hypothetical protein